MKPLFFAFLFERPEVEKPWSPLDHPGLFQVGYRAGTFPRIQQCSIVDAPEAEMRDWAGQAQALGLTPFLVMLSSDSPFANAWRTDPFLGTLLMGSVEVDLVLLEDILIYPEDEWLTRHLALCGHQAVQRLEANELPPLELLIPFSHAYRQWRENLDPVDEEDAIWRQADPSRIRTIKKDWVWVGQGQRFLLLNATCPLAFVQVTRGRDTATLASGGILDRLPAIRDVIPEKVDSQELVVEIQALSPWLDQQADQGKSTWMPAWLEEWIARLSTLGYGYRLAGVAVIVLQSGVIAYLLAVQPEMPYSEIRSPSITPSQAGPFISVSFNPEAKESEIRTLLVSLGASFVDGPSQLGDYLLIVETGRTDAVAEKLEQSPLVQNVTLMAAPPATKE